MTDPVDPNAQWRPPPPSEYQPPPPPAPSASSPDAPWHGYPPPGGGSFWVMGPDGRPVQAPWAAPQPPSHRRRNVLIAALVVVVLAAGGIGAYFAFRDNGSSHHLAVPQSFDGYEKLTNAAAQQVEASIRAFAGQQNGAARQMFDAATIGVYSHNSGDRPVLVALVLPTSAAPAGTPNSPVEVADGILAGASTDVSTFASGPHGGATRCGPAQFGAASETMCAWSDPATTGLLVSVNPPVQLRTLAAVSRAFRDKVD